MMVKTRTQRRVERKQAVVLLALVLAVALVSFTLGVLVGQGGAEKDAATAVPVDSEGRRHPLGEQATTAAAAAEMEAEPGKDELTFYDTLPKGEKQPLGSGINLPPQPREAGGVQAEPVKRRQESGQTEAVPASVPVPAAAPEVKSAPVVSRPPATEKYMLQVASFRTDADAAFLLAQLKKKGYRTSIAKVNLGDKGVWVRVLVGPYASALEAGKAEQLLKSQEKLSPLLRKL